MPFYQRNEDGTYSEVEAVPMHRFNEVNTKLTAATSQIEALTGELGTAQSAASKAAEQAGALQASLDAAEVRRLEDVALARAGITDDLGAKTARLAWESMPEDQRGSLADTLAKWRQDPAAVPRPMQTYFTPQQTAQPAEAAPAEPATADHSTRAQPNTNANTRDNTETGVNGSWTAGQIASMSAEDLKANMGAILKDIRERPA